MLYQLLMKKKKKKKKKNIGGLSESLRQFILTDVQPFRQT